MQWTRQLEQVLACVLLHVGLTLREVTALAALAFALASLIEGVWLNQRLSTRHPARPSQPIAAMLRMTGMMLWRGGVVTEAKLSGAGG